MVASEQAAIEKKISDKADKVHPLHWATLIRQASRCPHQSPNAPVAAEGNNPRTNDLAASDSFNVVIL